MPASNSERKTLSYSRKAKNPLDLATGSKYDVTLTDKLHVFLIEFEDVSFATDREILLPYFNTIESGPANPDRVTGIAVVRSALRFADRYPSRQLLVAGHTDTAGSESHNLSLSERRAENVHLYASGDKSGWASHCQENFEVEDVQIILKWIADTHAYPCNPGLPDNKFGPKTRTARENFRRAYNEEFGASLTIEGDQTTDDWEAFFDLYDKSLARLLECEVSDLASKRDAVTYLDPPTLGCGENWPREAVGINGYASRSNRRVELLFFDENEVPDFGGDSKPGEALYGKPTYKAEYISLDPEEPHIECLIRLLDLDGLPIADAPYRVKTGDEIVDEGEADGDGKARICLYEDHLKIVLEWTLPDLGFPEGKPAPYRHTYILDPTSSEDEEEEVLQMLHNLAYDESEDNEKRVRDFQLEMGLPISGSIADIREHVSSWHDGGEKPLQAEPADDIDEPPDLEELDFLVEDADRDEEEE